MDKKRIPVIVEQIFNSSVKDVWNAITEADQMRQWFFENIDAFSPEVGFETRFNVKSETRSFMHKWKLTEVIPLKKIVYDWTYEGISGKGYVTFELFAEEDKTRLRLTNIGLETFPQDIPEFKRESCVQGWNYFIKDRLFTYLERK